MEGKNVAECSFKTRRFYNQLRNVDMNRLLLFYTEQCYQLKHPPSSPSPPHLCTHVLHRVRLLQNTVLSY